MDQEKVAAIVGGDDPLADLSQKRHWWELLVVCAAVGVFVWLGLGTRSQHIAVSLPWMIVLALGTIVPLGLCGTLLWRRTRFS
jgi:cytochrome bd-type quinol oxidase subunit 2